MGFFHYRYKGFLALVQAFLRKFQIPKLRPLWCLIHIGGGCN